MVNGEELCVALLWTFYLTLDGITVINVFSHYNLLSVIQSNLDHEVLFNTLISMNKIINSFTFSIY